MDKINNCRFSQEIYSVIIRIIKFTYTYQNISKHTISLLKIHDVFLHSFVANLRRL